MLQYIKYLAGIVTDAVLAVIAGCHPEVWREKEAQ